MDRAGAGAALPAAKYVAIRRFQDQAAAIGAEAAEMARNANGEEAAELKRRAAMVKTRLKEVSSEHCQPHEAAVPVA